MRSLYTLRISYMGQGTRKVIGQDKLRISVFYKYLAFCKSMKRIIWGIERRKEETTFNMGNKTE